MVVLEENEKGSVMSSVRAPTRGQPATPEEPVPGARESTVSRYFLLWLVAAPIVGFALAGRVFDLGTRGDWEIWKAALLGALMMAPFAIGAYFGLRSVLKGFRGGWWGLLGNCVLGALAIGMPIWESVTS